MDVVELGGMRLHLLTAFPGFPGEAERVSRALVRLAPALVLADVDTQDGLRIKESFAEKKRPFVPGFVDRVFAEEMRRRFAPDSAHAEHPMVAAARFARDRRAGFVPLRALAPEPGFLARRRGVRAARGVEAKSPEAFVQGFEVALAQAEVWSSEREVEASHKRLVRAVAEGRAPVVAVLQAHRQAAFEDAILRTGRIPA